MAMFKRVAWCLLLPALVAGCSSGTLPPQASPDEARTSLATALDAWKTGESSDSLANRTPPIYFGDIRDRPDVRLLSFSVLDGHEFYGQSVRIAVQMTLKMPDGTTKERKASYLIDTAPAVVIVPG